MYFLNKDILFIFLINFFCFRNAGEQSSQEHSACGEHAGGSSSSSVSNPARSLNASSTSPSSGHLSDISNRPSGHTGPSTSSNEHPSR